MKSVQALWDEPIVQKKYYNLLNKQTVPAERARLIAVASEHASDWLNAIPLPSLGLKLDNTSLRIAFGLRLGSKMVVPHKCVCGNLVDSNGRHGLYCQKAKGTNPRHQQANDILRRSLAQANVTATLEPIGLSATDGKQPDGQTLWPWNRGKMLIWDYTCHCTLAPSYTDKILFTHPKTFVHAVR